MRKTKKEEENPVPRIIIFFGADGVGKTTQVRFLINSLKFRKYKVKRCWVRARHSLSYVLSLFLLRLGYPYFIYQGDIKLLDARTLPEKKLWCLIEFLSILPLVIIRFVIPYHLGFIIVAERFVIDTIAYNQFFIGDNFKRYSKILLRFIPRDSMLIHLDSEFPELASRREEDWPEEFIKYQLVNYRKMAQKLDAEKINTSKRSILETRERILKTCNIK
jgi:GTPase SAR1 family protein